MASQDTADEENLEGLESASQGVTAMRGQNADTARANNSTAVWRCTACDGPDLYRNLSGDWVCADCGGQDYYRVNEQTWRHMGFGTCMYFPEGQQPSPPWLRASAAASSASPDRPSDPPSRAPPPEHAW